MIKIFGGVIVLLVGILLMIVNYWSQFDALLTKLRAQGSAGVLVANILVSPLTFILMVIVACVLFFTAYKEFNAVRIAKQEAAERAERERTTQHLEASPQSTNTNINTSISNNTFEPKIEVKIDNKQSQQQSPYWLPPITAPSRFTADTRIARFIFDRETKEFSYEGYFGYIEDDLNQIPVDLALVRFYYEPDVGVYQSLDVVAYIECTSTDPGSTPVRIRKTIWLEHSMRKVRFDTTDDHELILAVCAPSEDAEHTMKLCEYASEPIEYSYQNRVVPVPRDCKGTEFLINIRLVGKWSVDDTVKYDQWFQTSLDLVPTNKIGSIRLLTEAESKSLRG